VWGPAVAWAAVLFLASAISGRGIPDGPPINDKVVHAVLYGVLGATLAFGRSRAPAPVRHVILLGIGAIYGVTDELHQMFVPGRSPDVLDWLADVFGLAVGYGTTLWLLGRKNDLDEDREETT